jgi:hypothetical protein
MDHNSVKPWEPTVYVHLVSLSTNEDLYSHASSTFSLDEKGHIEHGPIVQVTTLTGRMKRGLPYHQKKREEKEKRRGTVGSEKASEETHEDRGILPKSLISGQTNRL